MGHRVVGFEERSKLGARGVDYLCNCDYRHKITTIPGGRQGDVHWNYVKGEVKTEDNLFSPRLIYVPEFDIWRTPNFFMEYRNLNTRDLGGPWQADIHQCKIFAIFFIRENRLFVFSLARLLRRLDEMNLQEVDLRPVLQPDGRYALGWKVPRAALQNDCLFMDTTGNKLRKIEKSEKSLWTSAFPH